jgi:hypothetical protein
MRRDQLAVAKREGRSWWETIDKMLGEKRRGMNHMFDKN